MKRTPLIITILIILATFGGILLYQNFNQKKLTAWELIDDDAVMVIELPNLQAFINKLGSLSSLKSIIQLNPGLSRLAENKIAKEKKIVISLHPIASDDFGFLIYLPLNPITQLQEFTEFQNQLKQEPKLILRERVYNGHKIQEFSRGGKPVVSAAVVDELVVISNSSFLLEGAIRMKTVDDPKLFKDKNNTLFQLPSLQADDGNAYINLPNFFKWTRLFFDPSVQSATLDFFGNAGMADLKIDPTKILFNGFLVDSPDGKSNILSLFNDQRPQSFTMESVISTKTAAVMHYSLSDRRAWFKAQKNLMKQKSPTVVEGFDKMLERFSINSDTLRHSVGSQFATCFVNDGSTHQLLNILKIDSKDTHSTPFDELAIRIAESKNDSLYQETYSGYAIKRIDVENFLSRLFYPLAQPSSSNYFVRVGDHMLIADNVELIKTFIDDIEAENTWGKSVEWNNYLSASLQESNINLFFDGKMVSLLLKESFNARWSPFFDSTRFLGVDKGAVQISRLDALYYLNSTIEFDSKTIQKKKTNTNNISREFGMAITTRPFITRSHVDKSVEVLVQDSLNNLYLLSKDLKQLWKEPMSNKINGAIEQIDFFTNGKLQYFFATNDQLNIIDRLGRTVDGFPKKVMNGNADYSSVVDYDKSRNYRFLLSDNRGNLFLTDKSGELLEGWKPRLTNGKLMSSAKHYRILGRDYFVAVQQNGVMHLMNRRGESIKGFPVSLGTRPTGDFALERGRDLNSTYFTVVSDEGQKIQVSIDGQVHKREVLLKQSSASKFSLINSNDNSYVFLRTDPAKLGIMDENGKLLFEVQNQGSSQWQVTFLEVSANDQVFCLYDPQQDFSYFYDNTGKSILPQPIESTSLPSLYYNAKEKSVYIYSVFGSGITLMTVNR